MTTTLATRSKASTATSTFSVQVVDGNGVEVSGQPVTARVDLGGGYEKVLTGATDGWGEASFQIPGEARGVTVAAGSEIVLAEMPTGLLTIEM